MTSLAVSRTVPLGASASPDAQRSRAAAAEAIASAWGSMSSAVDVGISPRGDREKERNPQRLFKILNVAADGWLTETQPVRSSTQAARAHRFRKRPVEFPSWLPRAHANMNSNST